MHWASAGASDSWSGCYHHLHCRLDALTHLYDLDRRRQALSSEEKSSLQVLINYGRTSESAGTLSSGLKQPLLPRCDGEGQILNRISPVEEADVTESRTLTNELW